MKLRFFDEFAGSEIVIRVVESGEICGMVEFEGVESRAYVSEDLIRIAEFLLKVARKHPAFNESPGDKAIAKARKIAAYS